MYLNTRRWSVFRSRTITSHNSLHSLYTSSRIALALNEHLAIDTSPSCNVQKGSCSKMVAV